MKRIKESLWLVTLLICCQLSLNACSDEEKEKKPSILTTIILPESDEANPLISGTDISITGKGLTAVSSIYLEAEDAMKPDGKINLSDCIETDIKTIDDTEIVITLPAGLTGYYNVIFITDTDKLRKEKIYVTTVVPYLPSRILVMAETLSTGAKFYEWSRKENTFIEKSAVTATPIEAALGGNTPYVYYFGYESREGSSSLFRVDMKNNSCQKINTRWLADTDSEYGATGQAIGLINDKLYGVKKTEGNRFQVVRIEDDGKETDLQEFPSLADLKGDFNCDDDNLFFTYDALNRTILLTGWTNDAAVIALNMQTNTATFFQEKGVGRYACINVDNDIWLIGNKQVRKLDPASMTVSPTEVEYNSNWAYYAIYNKDDHCIYWVEENQRDTHTYDELHYYNTRTKTQGIVGNMDSKLYCPVIATY